MRFRILTYNIHKCIGGLDRLYRPERVAETIAHHQPDIVFMQEVANASRRVRGDKQVDWLAERLNFRHRTWFPNVYLPRGGEYGNAILSRFPITLTQNIDLTLPGRKRRSVLHARLRVRLDGRKTRTLHAYNLHLGLSEAERRAQLRMFLDSHPFVGLDHRTPILVAGDFNDVWGTLGKRLLVPADFRGGERPVRTFPAYAPVRALDSIYLRGSLELHRLHRSRLKLAARASDHLPLIGDCEITS